MNGKTALGNRVGINVPVAFFLDDAGLDKLIDKRAGSGCFKMRPGILANVMNIIIAVHFGWHAVRPLVGIVYAIDFYQACVP